MRDLSMNHGTAFLTGLACLSLILAASSGAHAARCDPAGVDAIAIADARAAIDAACDCQTAETHGRYVKCASNVLLGRIQALQLNPACKGTVQRCAAKSTCGKPGAVMCCRTNSKGKTMSKIARDAARCKAPAGGSACVSTFTSACDSCTASGCAIGTASFANHVQPILSSRCTVTGCHAGAAPAQDLDLSPGVARGNIVDIPSTEAPSLDRVEPTDPANSYLWMKITNAPGITGARMPALGGPLSTSEIDLITLWIEQGAADN
jgi:hypothetical protein